MALHKKEETENGGMFQLTNEPTYHPRDKGPDSRLHSVVGSELRDASLCRRLMHSTSSIHNSGNVVGHE